jgi:hypothetical protein
MRLRTRLNLVVAGLSASFVVVLLAAEIQSTRASVREETEAANRVASQFLGELASIYSNIGGPELVLQFLQQMGRIRANEVTLLTPRARSSTAHPRLPTRRVGKPPLGLPTYWRPRSPRSPSLCAAECCWSSNRSPRAPYSMPGTTSCG